MSRRGIRYEGAYAYHICCAEGDENTNTKPWCLLEICWLGSIVLKVRGMPSNQGRKL